ncbi:flagellar basal body-associated protein FliL [Vibrio sp. MEBiC08052]|uniref:flagellar basal body-associated protein FliL n=1 Tax=Vibrio sp. MEBiC08052 TaxID=1761910 RepID=UPI0007407721|nr:flagellar basal body-associated protein FliL [Vibrio sp. MEBiC08052]KUI96792.1 flagellar biosynthesis protein FliL [Vibrio sp. MEBiC08052]
MLKRYLALIILMTGMLSVSLSNAAEDSGAPKLAYFTLEPDLTTNFFTKGKELGYIQVRIEIMVANNSDLPLIEKNQPLIRDTVVELMGKQTADTIRSLAGREDLRKTLVKRINDLLLPETGRPIVADLLFTKYIYQ